MPPRHNLLLRMRLLGWPGGPKVIVRGGGRLRPRIVKIHDAKMASGVSLLISKGRILNFETGSRTTPCNINLSVGLLPFDAGPSGSAPSMLPEKELFPARLHSLLNIEGALTPQPAR